MDLSIQKNMTAKSQIEPNAEIFDLVKNIKPPITPGKLKDLQGLLFSKLEIRPYNEETKEHEQLIRWKRTASEILEDGYVYEGKACTDIVVLFLAMCKALGIEIGFVKVKKDRAVHSVAEIKLEDGWYIFDVSVKNSSPKKGEVTEKSPFQKEWILWKKGRDAWELGLTEFDSIKKIQTKNFMYKTAELLRKENKTTKDLVLAIGKFIKTHARSLPEQYKAKSIIESRFTPAEEAFKKGMLSCGAIANISTAVLRHLGFKVKLIHGEHEKSVDHAWISVYNPDTNLWTEYDLTRDDGSVPPTNKKKQEVNSWEEIKDQILEDHNNLEERIKQREAK